MDERVHQLAEWNSSQGIPHERTEAKRGTIAAGAQGL